MKQLTPAFTICCNLATGRNHDEVKEETEKDFENEKSTEVRGVSEDECVELSFPFDDSEKYFHQSFPPPEWGFTFSNPSIPSNNVEVSGPFGPFGPSFGWDWEI
jgi:hypothetical protein